MIYADKISFNREDEKSLGTIVDIHLVSDKNETWKIENELINGWYKKETVYRWLLNNSKKGFKIAVNITPYPILEPVENKGVKYVRSNANETEKDNLLELPIFYEK
ncbi:DUF3892 domain-containing protein [Staphylococcus xylosus]|uniref:DUF3892 domain-containing protein n=1 Tax=Staphylococcus xylosus TaxID=1288 RepID=UPI003F56465D